MVNCPYCGTALGNPNAPYCPNCGRPLVANPYGQTPTPGGAPSYQTPPAPIYGNPSGEQAYGQPPTPSYGQPAAPSYGQPTAPNYGQPAGPSYGQPPTPSYGQPAGPSYGQPAAPSYGQPAPPSYGQPTPGYGMPAAPSNTPYGAGAPSPWGMPPLPAPTPPKRSNTGIIIGAVAGVVVVVVLLAFALHALSGRSSTNSNVVYQSSLMGSGAASGWANDSHCSPQSDGYHVPDGHICLAPPNDIGDGTVSVDALLASGPNNQGYGLALRYSSSGNYVFVVDGNARWSFQNCPSNSTQCTSIQDFTNNAAIHGDSGSTNTLKVVMAGSHFTFYVNGTNVGQADDTTYTSGQIGVAGGFDTSVVFTNFLITH